MQRTSPDMRSSVEKNKENEKKRDVVARTLDFGLKL